MGLDARSIQAAIHFLKGLGRDAVEAGELPSVPDYAAIAGLATQRGLDVDPQAVAEAFRLLMRARLLALSGTERTEQSSAAVAGKGTSSIKRGVG